MAETVTREDVLARAGLDAEPAWATVAQLLAQRYSCRGFKPDPVPDQVLQELFSVAQLSASWCNSQPWDVILTRGEGTERFRAALSAHVAKAYGARETDFPFPEDYQGVFKERRQECGWQLYEAVGVQKGDREASRKQALENFRFFGAPHVAIITTERALGVYGAIDCGVYLGNLMLAAQSRGLATIAQAALAMMAPFIREYFGLPANRMIICGVSLGYEAPEAVANQFRTNRARLEDAVRWAD